MESSSLSRSLILAFLPPPFTDSSGNSFLRKAPKKDKKEETEDEIAFKEKQKAEAEARKVAREKGAFESTMVALRL